MASAIGTYRPSGPAQPGRPLRAAAVDLAGAAVIAILLWPFPLIRLTLGIPWSIHGPLIVVWVFVVYAVYLTVCVAVWGRSVAMYLLDLGLDGPARPFGLGRALRWSAGWVVAILPSLLGARSLADPAAGLPARFSCLVTVQAEAPSA